ncbi:MAG: cbb3-type cytochrome c oxidase subunit 3 [Rickettsiales bacterium]|nr:cbb3-type cytochrome c oxidase subunit 3 [Rickettsiales bacterium]
MSEQEIINYKIFSLIFFVIIFAIAVFYAFRPKNKKKFEEIAKLPMEDK